MYDLGLLLVELTITILIVAALLATVGRRRPRLAFALCLVALVKCLTPTALASPTGVFSWAALFWSHEIRPTAWNLEPQVAEIPADAIQGDFKAHYVLAPRQAPALGQPRRFPVRDTERWEPRAEAWLSSDLLLMAWLAGSGFLVVVLAVKLVTARRNLRLSTTEPRPEVSSCCNSLRLSLGLRRRPRLRLSADLGPVSFGVWRPTIVVPTAVANGPRRRLELVLAHELMHLKRRDPLLAWLQVATQIVWWFHPLVWWLNRRACHERERACDQQVMQALRCSPADYGRCLLEVVELRLASPLGFAFAAMPAAGLRQRFEQILGAASGRHVSDLVAWLPAVALLALLAPGSAPPNSIPAFAAALAGVWRVNEAVGLPQVPHTPHALPSEEAFRWKLTRRVEGLTLTPRTLFVASDHKSATVTEWSAQFQGSELSPAQWAALGACPAIVELDFEIKENGNADQVVGQLAALPATSQLHTIYLTSPQTERCELAGLNAFRRLKRLELDCPGFCDQGLLACDGLSELEILSLNGRTLSDVGLATLHNFPHLTHLFLDCPELTDQGAGFLAKLGRLKSLRLGSHGDPLQAGDGSTLSHITDDTVRLLAGCKDLRALQIYALNVSGAGLAELSAHASLRWLTLEAKLSVEGWQAIGALNALHNLRVLSLNGLGPGPQVLSKLTRLRSLDLDQVRSGMDSFANDLGALELGALSLHRTPLPQPLLETLQREQREAKLRGRKILRFSYSDAPPDGW